MKLFASEKGDHGKFATGINDASGNLLLVSTTLSVNLPAVLMTPVIINENNIRLHMVHLKLKIKFKKKNKN